MPVHLVIGAGPVGTTLALALADAGDPVRLLTRSGSGPEHPLVERMAGDVTDPAVAEAAGRDVGTTYGCTNAPYSADAWERLFPLLQGGGLRAARVEGGAYVAVENLYGYGPVDGIITESTPLSATGRKGAFRARLALDLLDADGRGCRTTAVRAGDFFGPHVAGSHVGDRFVPRLLAGRGVRVIGDPDAPHAFTYVPDLVAALVAAGARPAVQGKAWHAPITTASQRQLATAIAGDRAKVASYPSWALTALAAAVPFLREVAEERYQFERPFLVADEASRRALGVEATPVPEQVAATVAWWRAGCPGSWRPQHAAA